jgi:hypothetical protein
VIPKTLRRRSQTVHRQRRSLSDKKSCFCVHSAACDAARDMQVLMMIEQHEDANAVTPDKVNDAMLTMLHARIVCHEGHVLDALAIYDRIAQSITPESHASNRRLEH